MLTKDQLVDAAICRIAETHFDDAALIERYMTDLERQLADAAAPDIPPLLSDLAATANELKECRELLRDIECQCGILLLDKYSVELKSRMQEQLFKLRKEGCSDGS